MAESGTITTDIYLKKIKQEIKFEFGNNDLSITANPIACKLENDEVHKNEPQLHSYLIKEEIKEEFLEDSIKTEDHSVLLNTNIRTGTECNCVTNDDAHQCNYMASDGSTHQPSKQMGEDLFECNNCSYKTNDKFTLKLHVKRCISGQIAKARLQKQVEINKCDKCGYSTSKSRYLRQHLLRIHGETKQMLKCKLCNFFTYNELRLMVHEIGHTEKKQFKCDWCDYHCKYSSHLKEHMLKHSSEPCIFCDKCEYRTYSKSSLMRHKVIHSDDKPFKCVLCDFRTKRSSILKVHLQRHSGVRNFSCDKCEYKTFSQSTLTMHKRTHSEEKRFKCNSCDYRSRFLSDLKVHLNIHSLEHIFSCDNCDYQTYYKSNLTTHKRIHSEEKPFKCNSSDCRKKCLNSSNVHLGVCIFGCNKCDFKTNSRRNFTMHKKTHSEENLAKCKTKTRYKCTIVNVIKLKNANIKI